MADTEIVKKAVDDLLLAHRKLGRPIAVAIKDVAEGFGVPQEEIQAEMQRRRAMKTKPMKK